MPEDSVSNSMRRSAQLSSCRNWIKEDAVIGELSERVMKVLDCDNEGVETGARLRRRFGDRVQD